MLVRHEGRVSLTKALFLVYLWKHECGGHRPRAPAAFLDVDWMDFRHVPPKPCLFLCSTALVQAMQAQLVIKKQIHQIHYSANSRSDSRSTLGHPGAEVHLAGWRFPYSAGMRDMQLACVVLPEIVVEEECTLSRNSRRLGDRSRERNAAAVVCLRRPVVGGRSRSEDHSGADGRVDSRRPVVAIDGQH